MEKLKEYLWKRIVEDIENSEDEKVKNMIRAFKSKEDLIKFVKFYTEFGFDDMKRVASLEYFIRKEKYHHEPDSANTTLLYIERNAEKDLKGII